MAERDGIEFNQVHDGKAWLDIIARVPTSHPFTLWAWGEYKRRMGWEVQRVEIRSRTGHATAGCFQLQERRVGPIRVLLIQGGIHLARQSDTEYYLTLQSFLSSYVGRAKTTIVIVNHQAGSRPEADLGLLRSKFTPVVNSRLYTFVVDDAGKTMSGETLSRNWRHNLKRALNNSQLSARWVDTPSERAQSVTRLEEFYATLVNRKRFSGTFDFNKARDILVDSPEFKIVEALLAGEVIAIRVGLFAHGSGLDFLAASSEAAKSTYANYLVMWKMIEMARAIGASFDCGGIDPGANKGVYNFKKGLGGRLALSGPMWLYGSNAVLGRLARGALSFGP